MIGPQFPILIPLPLLLGAMLAAPLGLWKSFLAYVIAFIAVGASFFASVFGLLYVLEHGTHRYYLGGWPPPIGIEYVVDLLSAFVATVITGVSFLVIVYLRKSLQRELPQKKVPFLAVTLLLLAGLTGMIVAGDLFNLYVFLEIASLSTYALVASGEKHSAAAAFRYLQMGTIGASFYLLGVFFLYVETGSLNMRDVAEILLANGGGLVPFVALCFMIAGIGLKMALFPLHGWLPDAYTYAPSGATALLAATGTKVSAYVLIRILFGVFGAHYVRDLHSVTTIIGWVAAGGVIVGSIMAVAQKDLKRMLAYSSVSQIGYVGIGIGLASPLGVIGALLHILNHAVMKTCLFLVSGNILYQGGTREISQFDNRLRRLLPWTSASFTLAALAMIGIPPTTGFFSKWYLILASIERGNWLFVIIIATSSLLSAVYFFRILERMYLARKKDDMVSNETSPADPEGIKSREVPSSMLVPTLILAGSVLVLGLANAWIVDNLLRPALPGGL